jgi:DNA-binding MarR family transcriptional regulator
MKSPAELTTLHMLVLAELQDVPDATPTDVALRLGLEVDDVLRLFADLEARGMIERAV